jgi:hypothetical protein
MLSIASDGGMIARRREGIRNRLKNAVDREVIEFHLSVECEDSYSNLILLKVGGAFGVGRRWTANQYRER